MARTTPSEIFDWLDFDAFLKDVLGEGNVNSAPRWVIERLLGDFQSNLQAKVKKPKGMSIETMSLYGEEVEQDIRGVQVTMPFTGWSNPGEQIKTIAKDIFNEVTDWDDFESASRRNLWEKMLSDPPSTPAGTSFIDKMEGGAISALSARTVGRDTHGVVPAVSGGQNPLSLDNMGVKGAKDKDLYKGVKASVIGFQLNSRAAPLRDGAYDGVIGAMANALGQEFIDKGNNASFEEKEFIAKVSLLNSIETLDETVNGNAGKTAISQRLDKYLLTRDASQLSGMRQDLTAAITKAETSLQDSLSKMSQAQRSNLKSVIRQYETNIKSLKELAHPTSGVFAQLEVAQANGTLNTLLVTRARGAVDRVGAGGRTSLNKLTGGDLVAKSAYRKLARQIEYDIRNNSLFDNTKGGNKLRTILLRINREREYAEVEEFLNALDGGNFLKVYFWGRMKNESYTPAYWLNKALTRVHHFGMVVDSSLVDEAKGIRFGFGRFSVNVKGRAFENRFKLTVNHNGRQFVGSFIGGSHFKGVGTLGGYVAKGLIDDANLDRILHLDVNTLLGNTAAFNSELANMKALLGNTVDLSNADFEKFLKELGKLQKWMKDNEGALGGSINDPGFRLRVFKALHKYNINPDRLDLKHKYVGILEKAWSKLNVFQTALFSSKLGKPFKVIFFGKTMIAERIMDFLAAASSKLIDWFIATFGGAATGGIATAIWAVIGPLVKKFIMPLLKKILYAVVIKTISTVTSFLKGLATGDLSKVFIPITKTIDAVVKLTMRVLIIPVGCFMLLVLLFASVGIASISPTNPSVPGGGGMGSPGTGPGGSNNVCEETSIAASNCFFQDSYYFMRDSYDEDDASNTGHGSNDYWDAMANVLSAPPCAYSIPGVMPGTISSGPTSAGVTNNYCFGQVPASSAYGAAIDVDVIGDSCTSVYLPSLEGVTSWQVSSPFPTGSGAGYGTILTGVDGNTIYKIIMLHLVNINSGASDAGSRLGDLYYWLSGDFDNSHVHTELAVSYNGGATYTSVKPESLLCN